VKLTLSPSVASPLTEPVTATVVAASAALSTSSAVMGSTVIEAVPAVSTEWVEVVDAENGLPAASLPATVATKLVSAARSLPRR